MEKVQSCPNMWDRHSPWWHIQCPALQYSRLLPCKVSQDLPRHPFPFRVTSSQTQYTQATVIELKLRILCISVAALHILQKRLKPVGRYHCKVLDIIDPGSTKLCYSDTCFQTPKQRSSGQDTVCLLYENGVGLFFQIAVCLLLPFSLYRIQSRADFLKWMHPKWFSVSSK